jgi:hypothetical protein
MFRRLVRPLIRPAAKRARRQSRHKLLRMEWLEERATPAGLVAAYAFDEGAGGAVGDLSGNGNSGTIANANWTTAGRFGNALSFNGINAIVTINDANSLDLTSGMTLEAWIRPSVVNSWETVIMKNRPDGLAYAMFGGYPIAGYFTPPGTSNVVGTGAAALAPNTWSHLAATYDGATFRLYVNGSLISSQAATGVMATSANPLQIGGNVIWGEYFNGLIDEVRVYNRALAASEIQADMNTSVSSTFVDTTPPTVALAGPANGATVSGIVSISAAAFDNVGVVGVQFYLDGAPLGSEGTTFPYGANWDSSAAASGQHTLSARARDFAGNFTDSSVITVNVNNSNDPALVGQWSSVMNWPLVAINMVQMKNGKILMWDGGGYHCIGSDSARVWDPATNTFTPVPVPDPDDLTDIFCTGQTVLADGRVLIVGGHECNLPGWLGQANAYIFDPDTYQWTILPAMAYRRWYPTATALPDGRAIVIGGGDRDSSSGSYSRYPEEFDPPTNTWTRLTNGSQVIPNYPFVYVLPDGNVLVAGSDESPMATYVLNPATQTWSVVDPMVLDAYGSVMYEPGKVMKAGGSYRTGTSADRIGIPAAATTYVLDMTQQQPAWQPTAAMAYSRSNFNLTLLPDGSVAATGGSSDVSGESNQYAVLAAEIWSPATKTWTTVASMQTPRMYHSTALLLPDGRILSAGGGRATFPSDYLNAEIYSPPYLFKGARPTITDAPSSLGYGSSFFVQTPDSANIASVALIRNGSVTHGVDMDQRYVPLTFTQGTDGLNVQAPADANLAPPGYYMLFIANSAGVPSVAPFVQLTSAITLPGDYNSNQVVDAADFVMWRKQLGSSAILPNDTTSGGVTAADYNVWRANFGATAAQGEQAAGSTSIVSSQSAITESAATNDVIPLVETRKSVDAIAISRDASATAATTVATDVNVTLRGQRHPACSFVPRDLVMSQLSRDSLLLASVRTAADSVHRETNSSDRESDTSNESQDGADFSFFMALDNVFAELE